MSYYNTKPWTLHESEWVVDVTIDNGPTMQAMIFKVESDAPGMNLISAHHNLAVSYFNERELPNDWRELRKKNGLPIASPSAFPIPLQHSEESIPSVPSPDQLLQLGIALHAVAAFAATNRRKFAQEHFLELTTQVRDHTGAEHEVRVEWMSPDAYDDESDNPLDELRERAIDIAHRENMIGRLAWSFYLDNDPNYLSRGDSMMAALRFFDWLAFAVKGDGGTYAARAVAEAEREDDIDAELLDSMRRLANTRVGFYRVESTQRDVGVHLHDLVTGDKLFAHSKVVSRRAKTGACVVGILHQGENDEWIVSPSASLFSDAPTISEPDELTPSEVLMELETGYYGANIEWIGQVPDAEARRKYEAFRGALLQSGARLIDYDALKLLVRNANMPSEVMSAMREDDGIWESQGEVNVALAFLERRAE